MKREPTAEQFLKDVAEHQMRVHRDDGLYRHLEFRGPRGWHHWFEVVTWPNGLIIRGDMENWGFSRIEDMFMFFRGERINPGYWQEKLLASHKDAKEFSIDALREQCRSHLDNYGDELTAAQREAVMEKLESEIFAVYGDSESYPALSELFNFNLHGVSFDACDGPYGEVWDYHYIWCCHAIQWAIQKYDEARRQQ